MKEIFKKINNLNNESKSIFNRIYEIFIEESYVKLTPKLLEDYYDAQKQDIIVVRNKILNHETHFNIWRSKRQEPKESFKLSDSKYDPFCDVLNLTPEDDFGRLENASAITASNLAKSAKNHSLVIFKKHSFNNDDIKNALQLSNLWFSNFQSKKCKIVIWNFGYRAGASILHPHFQIFALDYLPLKINYLLERFENYKKNYNSNYLDDIFLILKTLDLAKEINYLKFFVNLSPFKDDEIFFFSENSFEKNIPDLANLLSNYYRLEIENFNFFLIESNWGILGFLINRGESEKINSDIGALEIYSFSVVGTNPFDLAERLFNYWS
ncbi:MAG: hypothetical protein KatS3mg095_0048 [Candidatus Parcubacteria bacterium]|nr:MAG: hypothetical protein KatS3mg095_0048 [Candidatus Parcubacteria bacterium]